VIATGEIIKQTGNVFTETAAACTGLKISVPFILR